ncbi:MAG TPA: autotransporter outer membrane beta-barrel domain-containing protein [Nitrospirota bacterium]|nr:autotransporter outer membrane beta-barrel domain-containing protein [Nitrospirota bacterium]
MKRELVIVLFFAAVAAAMTPGTVLAEPANSVNFAIGMSNFLPHCDATIYFIEYEHMLGSKISAVGRVSEVHYTFDDGEHVEDGRPKGADVGVRYYFSGGMKGFFVGGLVGYWKSDWTFTHNKNLPDEFNGNGRSNSLRANVDVGGRFPIGSTSISIMPSLNFGRYFSSTSCEYTSPAARIGAPCSEESEVTFYAFLAVTAGIAF